MPTRCEACNAPILFITTKAGKKIPVDNDPMVNIRANLEPNQKVVVVVRDSDIGHVLQVGDADIARVYKPHWATCTDPNRFRRN